MGKTVRATEPLAFSFQIWPRAQLTQKEVPVPVPLPVPLPVPVPESTLPTLSCGKHGRIVQNLVVSTYCQQAADCNRKKRTEFDTNLYDVLWFVSTEYNFLTVMPLVSLTTSQLVEPSRV